MALTTVGAILFLWYNAGGQSSVMSTIPFATYTECQKARNAIILDNWNDGWLDKGNTHCVLVE